MSDDMNTLCTKFNLIHKLSIDGKEYNTLSVEALRKLLTENDSYSCKLAKDNKLKYFLFGKLKDCTYE